ncbi:MAG: hypothetical protein Q4F67_04675 [Propionibacteriaceae bacterium]|nr:hypothetical protein [Propionibacteriaceae bacterium]
MTSTVEATWPPRPMTVHRWTSAATWMMEFAPAALGARPSDGAWMASLRSASRGATYQFDTIEEVAHWLAANTEGNELGDNIGTISWSSDDLSKLIQINAGNLWTDNSVRLVGVHDNAATDTLTHLVEAWIAEWGYASSGPTFVGPGGLTFGESTWVRSWRLLQPPTIRGINQSDHALGVLWTMPRARLFSKPNPAELVPALGQAVDQLDVLIPFWPRAWPRATAHQWYAESAAYPERRMTWENGQVQFHGVTTENDRSVALIVLSELWSWFHYDVGFEAWNAHFLDAARVHDAVIAQNNMGVRWLIAQEEAARATAALLRRTGSQVEVAYEIPHFE